MFQCPTQSLHNWIESNCNKSPHTKNSNIFQNSWGEKSPCACYPGSQGHNTAGSQGHPYEAIRPPQLHDNPAISHSPEANWGPQPSPSWSQCTERSHLLERIQAQQNQILLRAQDSLMNRSSASFQLKMTLRWTLPKKQRMTEEKKAIRMRFWNVSRVWWSCWQSHDRVHQSQLRKRIDVAGDSELHQGGDF